MNITDYLHAKFELAELLRAAAVIVHARQPEILYPFEDLFARLAEDRFNIAIIGQFSRGKTSLMNAMLNTERLPMGVVPVTSVITTVQYGTEERVTIEYAERRLPSHIALEDLSEFVTQRNNPGNEKAIRFARIELPSEILRQGFYLIDTPGLGSSILENTRTTEEFLPQADAFVVVTSYDSPLSDDELGLLSSLAGNAERCFVVINKKDLVDDTDRRMAEEHMRSQMRAEELEFFAVSAREAIAANRAHNVQKLQASGVPAFVERIVRFVIEEKNIVLLRRMAERIDTELSALNCVKEQRQLAALMTQLSAADGSATAHLISRPARPRFDRCAICAPVEREIRRFLQSFQYRITIDADAREALRADGGLCPFHTWQYATLASPHGTCLSFPAVFDPIIDGVKALREANTAKPDEILQQLRDNLNCILCRVRRDAESRSIAVVADNVRRLLSEPSPNLPDICLPHLAPIVQALGADAGGILLDASADSWQRTADDMRRYALKRDGSRRAFTTQDELDADIRGLRALAGHAALSYVREVKR